MFSGGEEEGLKVQWQPEREGTKRARVQRWGCDAVRQALIKGSSGRFITWAYTMNASKTVEGLCAYGFDPVPSTQTISQYRNEPLLMYKPMVRFARVGISLRRVFKSGIARSHCAFMFMILASMLCSCLRNPTPL